MKNTITKILVMITICLSLTGYSQTGVQIRINPSPTLYSVTGGGSYCAGISGVPVGLSGSEIGAHYQLVINGSNSGMPLAGTGSALNFGNQLMGGTYWVLATNMSTGCTIQMSNSVTIQVNPIPSVTITANGPVDFCGSGTVTLTANAGSNHTYQWYKNGSIINGANINQYVANATGMYKAIVTNNTTGCSNNHDTMVEVHALPQQFAVSSSSTTFCQGGIGVTIMITSSQIGVSYQLMLNGIPQGVAIAGTGAALAWTNQAFAGTYTVVATDNTTTCTSLMSGSAMVTMNPLPANAATITGPTSVCQNGVATYSITNIANANNYAWSVPNFATIISGQGTSQITVNFNNAVSGNVSVFGQNTYPCGNVNGQPSTLAVTINQAPTLTATANPIDVCAGNSTILSASGTGTSFIWSGGGNGQTLTVSPNATTTYVVTATSANGCTATGNVTVNVHNVPNVSLTLTEDQFCTSTNSAVISGGSPAGGIYSGNCIFANNTVYPPVTGTGTYTVTYTYTDSYGCSNFATDLLTINPVPAVMFLNIVGNILTDTPAFDLMSYVSPTGGTFAGHGVLGSTFNPATAGAGTHMLTYTYVHPISGCSASQIQYVSVGDGSNPNTGVDEVSINSINIYPNPANETLNLKGINTQKVKEIKIVDIVGREIYQNNNLSEDMQLDVASFASGSYFINFITTDGISVSKKFMKN